MTYREKSQASGAIKAFLSLYGKTSGKQAYGIIEPAAKNSPQGTPSAQDVFLRTLHDLSGEATFLWDNCFAVVLGPATSQELLSKG